MSLSLAVLLWTLLAFTAWSDCLRRTIPNHVPLAVALLWAVAAPVWQGGQAIPSAAIGSIVLLLGFGAWRAGWLGGGDVKLIAALSLWAGPDLVAGFLLTTTLSGGALAILQMLADRVGQQPLFVVAQAHVIRLVPIAIRLPVVLTGQVRGPARSLPYGVAVACGGAWLVHHLAFA